MFRIKEIISVTNAKLLTGNTEEQVSSVSTDTRTIKKGAIFFAIKGKNFDGHYFINDAIKKGARGVVISSKRYLKKFCNQKIVVIYVSDTVKALGELARHYRQRFSIPVIAITASAGKTTTKELIASLLSTKYCVLKNFSTENNQIGVSKTIFQLQKKHQLAILELGTNHFGEIKRLTQITDPSIAVMLNIGKSHLEFLKNERGVFREKASLYRSMRKPGILIYNNDDKWLCVISRQRLKHKKISFGILPGADVRSEKMHFSKKKIHFSVGEHDFSINSVSSFMVYNALAAIACGRLFKVSTREIKKILKEAKPPKGRQEIYQKKNHWIINDTYNANPLSVSAALESIKILPVKGRRVFVFGDMLELGEAARREHEKIAEKVIDAGVDVLVTVGALSLFCAYRLKRYKIDIFSFYTADQAALQIKKILKKDDAVLVKGSRCMRMEIILRDL